MAWVIIGGLITSPFLAPLVTPVMYKRISPEGHEPVCLESPAAAPQAASGSREPRGVLLRLDRIGIG